MLGDKFFKNVTGKMNHLQSKNDLACCNPITKRNNVRRQKLVLSIFVALRPWFISGWSPDYVRLKNLREYCLRNTLYQDYFRNTLYQNHFWQTLYQQCFRQTLYLDTFERSCTKTTLETPCTKSTFGSSCTNTHKKEAAGRPSCKCILHSEKTKLQMKPFDFEGGFS